MQNIKKFITLLIPPLVLNLLKKKKKKKIYFGLNNIDEKLSKYLDYKNGYYIELGANNGVEQSNTLYFENKLFWSGILIEPILHKYLHCKKRRSKKNKFFNNACVSFDFKENYVKLLYSNLMTTPINMNSDLPNPHEHAGLSNKQREEQIEVVEFLAIPRTLNSILIESDAPKLIDLLSLDVEGAELEVLKGVDFKNFNFKYMLIECRNFSKINDFLKNKKYILENKLSSKDYLFKYEELNGI